MVLTPGRPRAHSASSLKINQVLQQLQPPSPSSASTPYRNGHSIGGGVGGADGKKLSYSSPELRSMLVGLETTVPQNLNPPSQLGSRHKPYKKRRKIGGSKSSLYQLGVRQEDLNSMGSRHIQEQGSCCGQCCLSCCAPGGCCGCCSRCCSCSCCCCGNGDGRRGCCRIHILLVLLQFLLGAGVTSLSVYMHLFLPVFIMREKPMWAGAPLCAAGILGIYFCATNFNDYYSKTARAYALKVLCSILSAISIVVCITAAIFASIHLGRIFTYTACTQTETDCRCTLPQDELDGFPRLFAYPGVEDCLLVFCEVKLYLVVSGSLCLVGSLVSLWFTVLLWKARYGRFHSGVRLPSVKRKYNSAPNL